MTAPQIVIGIGILAAVAWILYGEWNVQRRSK